MLLQVMGVSKVSPFKGSMLNYGQFFIKFIKNITFPNI